MYTTDTVFVQNHTSKNGCDSLVKYTLTFEQPIFDTINYVLCYGDTVNIEGRPYSEEIVIESPTKCSGKITHIISVIDNIALSIENNDNVLSLEGSGFENHEWVDCSDNSIVFSGAVFEPKQSGEYKVKAVKDGCFYESECTSILLAADDFEVGDGIILYPNPVKEGVLNIKFHGNDEAIKAMWLTDVLGNQHLLSFGPQNQIDVRKFNEGLYFLKVYSGKKVYTKKVVISND